MVPSQRSADEARPIRIVCVGAGVSGILAAIKLPQFVKGLSLAIYDKNEELGGTWYENRYPGCACDIPSHSYQLSFESSPTWSQFYASAPEILEYWKAVADKYQARQYMKLAHEVTSAAWDEKSSKWAINVRDLHRNTSFVDHADILITAIGILNKWTWPKVPGLEDFNGKLMHSAAWETDVKYEGLKVAVVGAGSSGIQIVPAIQPFVARLDHYVRGKTWISTPFAAAQLDKRGVEGSNFYFTESEKKSWKNNPTVYLKFRKALEQELQSSHPATVLGSDVNSNLKALLTERTLNKLETRPAIAKYMIPEFPPGCKRLTPGPGYLEALIKGNVDVISTPIERIEPTGIRTIDGQLRNVDLIVCATGFDTSHKNRFPIKGRNGQKLSDKWQDFPENYLSMTTDGFPNMFMSLGPNSAQGAGNLLIFIEKSVEYMAKCIAKMQNENIQTMEPRISTVQAFTQYSQAYFENTVFSEKCSSWYKSGINGRVSAIWPGSSLHAVHALNNPRWEDFEYSYMDGNVMGWLGDGWSVRDREDSDRAYYLSDTQVEVPDLSSSMPTVYDNEIEHISSGEFHVNGTHTLVPPATT